MVSLLFFDISSIVDNKAENRKKYLRAKTFDVFAFCQTINAIIKYFFILRNYCKTNTTNI